MRDMQTRNTDTINGLKYIFYASTAIASIVFAVKAITFALTLASIGVVAIMGAIYLYEAFLAKKSHASVVEPGVANIISDPVSSTFVQPPLMPALVIPEYTQPETVAPPVYTQMVDNTQIRKSDALTNNPFESSEAIAADASVEYNASSKNSEFITPIIKTEINSSSGVPSASSKDPATVGRN